MDKASEKLLVKALELISITANEAWWHDRGQHCGNDYNVKSCQPCFAFDQCTRNESLIRIFSMLIPAGG